MRTFADVLLRAAGQHGDRLAVRCGTADLSFAELVHRCRQVGGLLDALGTGPGDRVALWSANSAEYVEIYAGVPAAGRVVVPLNTRWTEHEIADAVVDSGASVLLCDRDPGTVAEALGEAGQVVRLDPDDGHAAPPALGYHDLLAAAPAAEFHAAHEDDLAGLFYTGGTTGRSKGVMLTHRNLLANTAHSQTTLPLVGPGDTGSGGAGPDVYLVVAPMFHAAGSNSVLQCIALGVPQVILPAFDPAGCLEAIETQRCTTTLVVPAMLAALLEAHPAAGRDVGSMRLIAHGASPIAMEVVRRASEVFANAELVHLYGTTETAPLLSGLRHEELLTDSDRGKSAGRPVLGVSLRIEGPDGRPAPAGAAGEVLASGANVMAGYWNRPDETAAALVDGWYRTGDIGLLDDEGYLYIVDRAKDMIVSGGENVYCSEVEEVLFRHPKVLEATVFGVPHERWGEQVHAVVVARDPSLTEAELVEFCRGSLAGYKLPRSVSFHDGELPKSGPGKVLKRELREPYWEGR
ncbi:MAG TPA: AMP-dependent synthetase, partial [Acidimicrobiaceae bacterium]|nr:AMP-dependent synthetase [Acidimicrobiaceae bacterium]